jgi:hypothetical protein
MEETMKKPKLSLAAFFLTLMSTDALSPGQVREEQAGQMVLRMHGGMGPGMMPMMRERRAR